MESRDLADLTDEDLAQRFRETREADYFAELFKRYKKKVFYLCRRILRNSSAAEDLMQDTFERAFLKIDQFHGGRFPAWLNSIARSLCINRRKSAVARREIPATHDLESIAVAQTLERRSEFACQLKSALRELSPEQRRCCKLFFIEGYSYREIMQLTGLSYDEVKAHVQNGKRGLKKLLERQETR